MAMQARLTGKTFLTLITYITIFPSVSFTVHIETATPCKPFVTHCTQIRSWLVITWMLSNTNTVSFSLHLN